MRLARRARAWYLRKTGVAPPKINQAKKAAQALEYSGIEARKQRLAMHLLASALSSEMANIRTRPEDFLEKALRSAKKGLVEALGEKGYNNLVERCNDPYFGKPGKDKL